MVEQIQKESATKMKAILSQIRLTNLQLDEIKEAASMEFEELRGQANVAGHMAEKMNRCLGGVIIDSTKSYKKNEDVMDGTVED